VLIIYGPLVGFLLGAGLTYIGFKQWLNRKVWLKARGISARDQVHARIIILSLVVGIPLFCFIVAYVYLSLTGVQ
jgi:H+/gluconate symporter-like permease